MTGSESIDKRPLILGLGVLLGLAFLGVTCAALGGANSESAQYAVEAAMRLRQPQAPDLMQAHVEQAARNEQGRNALIVRSVDQGWVAGYRGSSLFPMGSLRRLWLATALLDVVDSGELSLDDAVPLRSSGRTVKLADLLHRALQLDDRVAQDEILDGLQGPEGMNRWCREKGLDELLFGSSVRGSALVALKGESNADGVATADGFAEALARLLTGDLVSAASTRRLTASFTALKRDRALEADGWEAVQMTGGGAKGRQAPSPAGGAVLLRSPEGRRFVIVVFTEEGRDLGGRRDRLLRRAITLIEAHAGRSEAVPLEEPRHR